MLLLVGILYATLEIIIMQTDVWNKKNMIKMQGAYIKHLLKEYMYLLEGEENASN